MIRSLMLNRILHFTSSGLLTRFLHITASHSPIQVLSGPAELSMYLCKPCLLAVNAGTIEQHATEMEGP